MRVFACTISVCPSQKQRALAEVLLVLENGGLMNGARYIYTEALFMHHMIHYFLYCSVKHQLAMKQGNNTETSIVTIGTEQ